MKKDDILYDKLTNLDEQILNFQNEYGQEKQPRNLHNNSNFFFML